MSAELIAIILVGVVLGALMLTLMGVMLLVFRRDIDKMDKRISEFNTHADERSGKMHGAA